MPSDARWLAGLLLVSASCTIEGQTTTSTGAAGSFDSGAGGSGGMSTGSGGGGDGCPPHEEGRVAIDLAALNEGGMALLSDGTLWCWGNYGTVMCPVSYQPMRIEGLPCLRSFEAIEDRFAGVGIDGSVWVVGEETDGKLTRVADGGMSWTAVNFQLAAWGDGQRAWWWGAGQYFAHSSDAITEIPWSPIEGMALSNGHGCYWGQGELYCFGRNVDGEVGNGSVNVWNDRVSDPARPELPGAVRSAAVERGRTFAILEDGEAWTWGLEDAAVDEPSGPSPLPFPEVGRVDSIMRGALVGCALSVSGELACWGGNPRGVLIHTEPPEPRQETNIPPTRLHDLEPAAQVSNRLYSPLCAIKWDGTLWCRGIEGTGATYLNDDGSGSLVEFVEREEP